MADGVIGGRMTMAIYAAPRKSKLVAGVLALSLGGFGAHKFYLDRPASGLVYLLFCWTLIPALIAIGVALSLLLTSDEDFETRFDQPKRPVKTRDARNYFERGAEAAASMASHQAL
jgi:TM2 domain-containing membrane protein YozV